MSLKQNIWIIIFSLLLDFITEEHCHLKEKSPVALYGDVSGSAPQQQRRVSLVGGVVQPIILYVCCKFSLMLIGGRRPCKACEDLIWLCWNSLVYQYTSSIYFPLFYTDSNWTYIGGTSPQKYTFIKHSLSFEYELFRRDSYDLS